MGRQRRKMDSRREQRLQEATRELNEEEQAEADRQRAKEDEMIAQVEKDFFEYTKKLEEGTIEQVVAESRCGPGIPVGAPVLDSIIDDEALDRLLEFFEKGGTVDLQASDDQPQLELEEGEAASVPHADPETIKKAEEVVKMLTQQIQTLETKNTAAAIEQQEEEETVVVDPLSACVLPAPEFEMSESEDSVTLRISLPAVRKVGQIDAEVVERSRLELRVPELYSLDYTFSKPVDDDQMSCRSFPSLAPPILDHNLFCVTRFEKTTKTLVIKMPLLVS